MPRIRKKTSNRQNTRDRAKITKKVSEHRKKTKRDIKKNVTWKSKKKADPGVPNNFPYKDRVLAEMAEEKRRNEEAKQAKRDANKRHQQGLDEEDEENPGIMSLTSGVLSASAPIPVAADEEDAEDAVDVPDLVDTALPTLQDVMDRADVVMQVVDARDILGGRSSWVEKIMTEAGGKYVLLVNKIDLVPRENLNAWIQHLPEETYLFSSNPPASDPSSSTRPGKTELLAAFAKWSSAQADKDLTVALMGLPNVGKTSILNELVGAAKYPVAPVYPTAAASKNPQPTTLKPVEVSLTVEGKKVAIIDTPGFEFAEDDPEDEEEEPSEEKYDEMEARVVGDLLRRNLGRIDRIKDVFPLVHHIVKRSNAQDLMLAYNVPYFQDGDIDTFLLSLARANGRIRKHGDADIESAARIVLRDWATSTFPYYSTPPTTPKTTERSDLEGVLSLCRTRKELRATGKGVIRFKGGDIDQRDVIVDDDFNEMAGSDDDEDAEDDDDEGLELDSDDLILDAEDGEELDLEDGSEPPSGSDVEEEEEDEVDAEDDEDDEEEERSPSPPPAMTNKQKRKRKSDVEPVPPKKAKRVSFGKNEVRVMKAHPGAGNKRKRN